MKTVLLLRHAKSDRSEISQPDFDRPLAKRGLTDAPRIGQVLARLQMIPDKILSSPAQRAKQTAKLAAKACGYKEAIEWCDSFYDGDSQALIQALQQLPNTVERAMLVGHNPMMEETAAGLLLRDRGSRDEYLIKMPTAALVCLELDITDWAALESGHAVLNWFLIPQLMKALE